MHFNKICYMYTLAICFPLSAAEQTATQKVVIFHGHPVLR